MSKPKVLAFIDWYKPYYKAGGPVRSMVNMVDHLGGRVQFNIVTGDRDYIAVNNEAGVLADQWTKGDVLVIDDRATLHRAHGDYDRTQNRVLWRIIVEGDRPVLR